MRDSDRVSRRGVIGTVALASSAALLATTVRAQQPAAPDPAKPFYAAPNQALPYKPMRVKSSDGVAIAAQ